ncbi:MAG: MFS transporter, partial [Deltaproteobacteria bacterium]|nr:MFS transporter [Deltaproteobacteria bacterium]
MKERPVCPDSSPPGRGREKLHWKSLAVLTSAHLITDAYNNFLPPLIPLLMQKMNLSLTLSGSLITIRALASFFTQPAVGYVSDRSGVGLFVIFGPLVMGIFISLLGIAPSYWFLALCLIMGGIGHSALHPQSAAMIGDIDRRRAGFFMSVWMIGGTIGMAIGPLIVTVVVSIFGLIGTLYTVVFAVIITIFLIKLAPAPPPSNVADAYSLRAHLLPKMGSLALLWFLVVIRSATGMSFLTFLSVLLIRKGFPLVTSGLAVSLYTGGGVLGGFIGGTLSDYVGKKKVMLASFLLSPVVLLLFLKSHGTLSLGFLIIGGLCMWGTNPVIIVAAQEIAPESRTLVSSMMMGLAWGVGNILVTVTGFLGDTVGLENALQWILLLPLIGVALVALGVKDSPESQ